MTNPSAAREDAFDLNIGKVLEHWTVPFAIREVLANALDEAAISGTAEPEIAHDEDGSWHIRDFGRGLRYAHLTQNESAEKRRHSAVIGQFGMGLKDALATFDRRDVAVTLRSRHSDIVTGKHGKAGKFSDVITLHALVRTPSDLAAFTSGRQHDELGWIDVALHACRVLQSHEKVLFVTSWQLADGTAQLRYAQDDGYRLVTVPDDIGRKLTSMTDLSGQPLVDLGRYQQEWNASFSYTFVRPDELAPAERHVFDRTKELLDLVGCRLGAGRVKQVLVSETMRLSDAGDMVFGTWEHGEGRIVVRRSELATLNQYAGTLLHEFTHAKTGHQDRTLEFESALSEALGKVAAAAVEVARA